MNPERLKDSDIRYFGGNVTLPPGETPETFAGGGVADRIWQHTELDLAHAIRMHAEETGQTIREMDPPQRRGPIPEHDPETGQHVADIFQTYRCVAFWMIPSVR